MGLKTKILRVYFAAVIGLAPIAGIVRPVAAEPGNFSVTFDAPSVSAGQQDVPVHVMLNSNSTDVTFAGCEIDIDGTLATFSHGTNDNGSFTSDFAGPNGNFDAGGAPDQQLFYTNASPAVTASAAMEVYVMYYDISASASGSIDFAFDSADTSNCLINDGTGTPFTTISGATGTLNVSGVTVTESSSSTDVVEGGATDTFDVVLDAEPASNVTVDISNDAQATTDVSSLVFTNGNWNVAQTVTVTAVADASVEGPHTSTIGMSVNGSSDPLYTGLTLADVTANVTEPDSLLVEFTNTTSSDNEADGGNLPQIVVSGADTTGGSAESVDVTVTGGDAGGAGDDYTFTDPETITIPAGDYTTPQVLSLSGLSIADDGTVEADETIVFGLTSLSSNVLSGDADGDLTTESTHTYTINNDDGLLIELSDVTAGDDEDTGGNVPTLIFSGAVAAGTEMVDVNITGTANGTDYTSVGTTVTIPAGDYTTVDGSVGIGLTIDADTTVEADDTVILTLASPVSASIGDADGTDGVEGVSTYTITNDDQLTAELTDITASDVEATGGNIPQILVNGTTDIATTIRIDDQGTGTATNGSDYTLSDPIDVAVPIDVYDGLVGTALDVPLTIGNDMTLEADETIDFVLSAPEANIILSDVDSVGGIESTHTYTITNDDQLTVEFDVTADSANEDAGYTPVLRVGGAVLAATATVEVTDAGGGSATGADYTFTSPQEVTIPIGDYSSGTMTVNVPGLSITSDGFVELDETINFGIQNPSTGVVIGDADTSGSAETALAFTITNDDALIVEFTNTASSDNENSGGNLPQVVVSGADTTGGSAESVDVTDTGAGSAVSGDYTFTTPEMITIPAADYTTPVVFSLSGLSITGDTTIEGDDTIAFSLTGLSSNLSLGDADGDLTTESAHTYTINNDDGLLVELSTTTGSAAEDGTSNVPTLIVSGADTTGGSAETVEVTILGTSTADGTDYTSTGSTITIPAADYTSAVAIPIGLTISTDTTVEANDIIDLSLNTPSAGVSIGDADGTSGVESSHVYTITNDDYLTVSFSSVSASDNEATGLNVPTVYVTGTSDVAGSVTVDDAQTGSATIIADYTFTDPTVIPIPAGTYTGTASDEFAIALTVSDDATVETNETIILNLGATSYTTLGANAVHTYTIANDDASAGDADNDGISDSVEDAGPNGGDANGDGTPDSAQASVSSVVNALIGQYVALEVTTGSCSSIGSHSVVTESSQTVQDGSYDYPQGLNDFTLSCGTAGDTVQVTIILDQLYDSSSWTVRKLNRLSTAYSDLTSATFGTRTVGSATVTSITYSATDGGANDEDGTANGTIVDPVGIAEVAAASEELSETGANLQGTILTGLGIIGVSILLFQGTRRYKTAEYVTRNGK